MDITKLKKELGSYDHKTLAQVEKNLLRTELLKSLYLFSKFLGYEDVNPETHSTIINALESQTKRKVIVEPRGSFKSTIGSICYPLWKLLRDPNERILIDSEIFSNSVTYLRSIKEHILSEKFITVFGNIQGEIWREDSITVKGRTKTYKEAAITCGGVETTKVGQHYSSIIGDDYNSPQNSDTKDKARKVIDHFRYNLNILEPGGEYVIIGTRYSEDDLIGWILREILGLKELSEGKDLNHGS